MWYSLRQPRAVGPFHWPANLSSVSPYWTVLVVSAGDVGQKDKDDTVFFTGRVELLT